MFSHWILLQALFPFILNDDSSEPAVPLLMKVAQALVEFLLLTFAFNETETPPQMDPGLL